MMYIKLDPETKQLLTLISREGGISTVILSRLTGLKSRTIIKKLEQSGKARPEIAWCGCNFKYRWYRDNDKSRIKEAFAKARVAIYNTTRTGDAMDKVTAMFRMRQLPQQPQQNNFTN